MTELQKVIINYCHVDECLLIDNLDMPLFLPPFNLMPEDLVLLILKIENDLKIHFKENQFEDYKLLTINGIQNQIDKCRVDWMYERNIKGRRFV